jgi:hypothetical protein
MSTPHVGRNMIRASSGSRPTQPCGSIGVAAISTVINPDLAQFHVSVPVRQRSRNMRPAGSAIVLGKERISTELRLGGSSIADAEQDSKNMQIACIARISGYGEHAIGCVKINQ